MNVDWGAILVLVFGAVFNAGINYGLMKVAVREVREHGERIRKLEIDGARHFPEDWKTPA